MTLARIVLALLSVSALAAELRVGRAAVKITPALRQVAAAIDFWRPGRDRVVGCSCPKNDHEHEGLPDRIAILRGGNESVVHS